MQAAVFQREVGNWYGRNGRDLPWRRTQDPYAVTVSEVMLQQTQVATVLPFYHKWLTRFPNVAALAAASPNDVLHAWQGLGYYARARNLHQLAQTVQHRHDGIFPSDVPQLRALPGVGRYTANAIATFAFDRSMPIVEANTARLLARLFNVRKPIDSGAGREALWSRAAQLIPSKNAARFNSALIDIGATICLPRAPRCEICPIRRFCRAKDPASLPRKRARPATIPLTESHEFIRRGGRILLVPCTTRWRGMWMLPARDRTSPLGAPVYTASFPFTNHRITLEVFGAGRGLSTKTSVSLGRGRQRRPTMRGRWFTRAQLDRIPLPSPHRRAIEQLLRAA